MKMFLVLLLCHPSQQSLLFKSAMKLNPLTRGYEDIKVVVGKHLEAENCVQILEKIKVN